MGKIVRFVATTSKRSGVVRRVASALLLVSTAVLGLASCSSAPEQDEPVAASVAPINGGQLETGYRGVGVVHAYHTAPTPTTPSTGQCTGILISPSMVLTAGHCMDGYGPFFSFGLGANGNEESQATSVYYMDPFQDLGVLIFETPYTDVQPLALSPGGMPATGKVCTAVGFGLHLEADGTKSLGTKRSAQVKVTGLDHSDTSLFRTTWVSGSTDGGDSGGPLFCDGLVKGVAKSVAHEDPTHLANWAPIDMHWINNMQNDPVDRCSQDSDLWCCNTTAGTVSSCANRTIRFNYGGAAVAGGLNNLSQTTRFGVCDTGNQKNYDFISGSTFGTGFYRIRSTTTDLCIAPNPSAQDTTLTLIACNDCSRDFGYQEDRCLWKFTSGAGGEFKLQNKITGKCLYSPQGENYTTSGLPLQQQACSSKSSPPDTTYERELLFLDNFPCP